MKKLLTILTFILIGFISKAQFPFTQTLGNSSTLVKVRGGLGTDSVFVLITQFTDTATANYGYLKNISGAIIRTTGDSIWMRNNSATAWNQINGAGGGGGSGTVTSVSFTGGLISVANPTTTPALTVAGTSGGIPYFSSASTWASSGLLAANALMIGGGAGVAPSTTTTGTGVLTALGINQGSAGSIVLGSTVAANQIAYGSAANTITSSSELIFDGNNILFNGGTETSATSGSIVMAGSNAHNTVNAIVFTTNGIDSSHNTFMGGGQNTVIQTGAAGSVSLSTDSRIHRNAAYSVVLNDANGVKATAATVGGFSTLSAVENSFTFGDDVHNGLLTNNLDLATLNAYIDAHAIGSSIDQTGNRKITLGHNIQSTGEGSFVLGSGMALSPAIMGWSNTIGFGTNSDSLTLLIFPAAGTTGTYGATYARGTFAIGSVANDNTETKLLVWNSAGAALEYRDVSSITSSTTWNGITDPTGTQTLTFDDGELTSWTNSSNTETFLTITNNSLTTGKVTSFTTNSQTSGIIENITSISTAKAMGNALSVHSSSGANGTSGITNVGDSISVTNTGTSSTNEGLKINVSGASTNNAINVLAGVSLFPAGSATAPSIKVNGDGIFSLGNNIGIYGSATGFNAFIGGGGLALKSTTSVIDIGQSSSFSTTNMIRINAPSEGTVKFATIANTAAVNINATAGQNTASSLLLIADQGDDAADTWTISSATTNVLTFANTSQVLSLSTNGGLWSVRRSLNQGADVASAAGAIALGTDGNVFEITGTAAITLISNLNWQNGAEITLIFTSTASLTDGTANSGTDIGMELAGGANFSATADDTITLVLSEMGGTQRWREKCRSVN